MTFCYLSSTDKAIPFSHSYGEIYGEILLPGLFVTVFVHHRIARKNFTFWRKSDADDPCEGKCEERVRSLQPPKSKCEFEVALDEGRFGARRNIRQRFQFVLFLMLNCIGKKHSSMGRRKLTRDLAEDFP